MVVTAAEILLALRFKYSNAAVVKEVTVPDRFQKAIENRWRLNLRHYPGREEEMIARGEDIAEMVPDGWDWYKAKFERRIDAVIFGPDLTAVEIKVSRADFFRDTYEKRRAWMEFTHRFVYVTPAGLVSPDEIGENCGLLEYARPADGVSVYRHGLSTAKRAKRNKDPRPLPPSVLRAFAGRVSRAEKLEALK
jgi:hypothetical protein